jgi:molybdopterin synthase sulfur carrier subunit
MKIHVSFWSYFKDHTGCENAEFTLEPGSTVGDVRACVYERFPVLGKMRGSTLVAVDVDYCPDEHVVSDGDCVSLFPPVQGG